MGMGEWIIVSRKAYVFPLSELAGNHVILTFEQAFDISLLASIASHMTYWADEDVSHFMISQLLARHRVFKPKE
jgi:hypothetical protein